MSNENVGVPSYDNLKGDDSNDYQLFVNLLDRVLDHVVKSSQIAIDIMFSWLLNIVSIQEKRVSYDTYKSSIVYYNTMRGVFEKGFLSNILQLSFIII